MGKFIVWFMSAQSNYKKKDQQSNITNLLKQFIFNTDYWQQTTY